MVAIQALTNDEMKLKVIDFKDTQQTEYIELLQQLIFDRLPLGSNAWKLFFQKQLKASDVLEKAGFRVDSEVSIAAFLKYIAEDEYNRDMYRLYKIPEREKELIDDNPKEYINLLEGFLRIGHITKGDIQNEVANLLGFKLVRIKEKTHYIEV